MCLISGRASDPFHGHTAANLSMKPSRRQIPGNDSQSKSKSFALEDIYRSIRASYYTPNESYHCPHTCSMWISAAFTYTPAYRPPHVASYGQKYKATSGQQDLLLSLLVQPGYLWCPAEITTTAVLHCISSCAWHVVDA
jgi:hypothetical protein